MLSLAYFPLGGKFLLQKSFFVCKYDSARKLNGFLLLGDVAFPQANHMAGKGLCERNIPPSRNQALLSLFSFAMVAREYPPPYRFNKILNLCKEIAPPLQQSMSLLQHAIQVTD